MALRVAGFVVNEASFAVGLQPSVGLTVSHISKAKAGVRGIFSLLSKGKEYREDEVKSYTEYLVFETKKRREMVHITDEVERIVGRSGVRDGLCFVSPMHITAAVYVNDLESGLIEDIGKWLEELAPARPDYKHHRTGEDNGDAHLKSLLLHHETTLPVTNGKLDLGTWQRVFYAEFDGQRRKRVIVKVLGME
ncbi:MAG: secondary thiamine-phosphate synthase enzyme YjbQ [Terracidiphilus sp.]|jgi:secondary thiamine-phosphate synthase enzyme